MDGESFHAQTYISEIQCSVNLVHDVQWRRLVVVQRKHECERTQRLFATGEVGDISPALFRWHDAKGNAFAEGIQTVDKLQLCVSAHGDHLVHLLEAQRDGGEALHEAFETQSAEVIEPLLCRTTCDQRFSKVRTSVRVIRLSAPVLHEDG